MLEFLIIHNRSICEFAGHIVFLFEIMFLLFYYKLKSKKKKKKNPKMNPTALSSPLTY